MRAHDAETPYEPSAGLLHGIAGIALLAVASPALGGVAGDDVALAVVAVAASGTGLYLLVAGAVARGIQLSRRPHGRTRPTP